MSDWLENFYKNKLRFSLIQKSSHVTYPYLTVCQMAYSSLKIEILHFKNTLLLQSKTHAV